MDFGRCPKCLLGRVLEWKAGEYCSRRYATQRPCDWMGEPVRGHGNYERVAKAIHASLTPELLKQPYRRRVESGCDPMTGHCYVASEAAYHMLGGKHAGWKAMFVNHEGSPHWFLLGPKGERVDITASQFRSPVPYDKALGKGFLTKEPSARARTVIERATARM